MKYKIEYMTKWGYPSHVYCNSYKTEYGYLYPLKDDGEAMCCIDQMKIISVIEKP